MAALLRTLSAALLLYVAVLTLAPPTHAALRDWRPSDFRYVTYRSSLGGECCQPYVPLSEISHAGRRHRYSVLPLWDGHLLW